MIEAVLFDWVDTLMDFSGTVDDEFRLARTQAGLAALGRKGLPDAPAIGEWFRSRQRELFQDDREDEVDLVDVFRACFADLGCELSNDDVLLYAQASLWETELSVPATAHALLEALRASGLKLAIVSNTPVPPALLAPVFERQGLAERVDAIVLSSGVGKRKPHAAIFERALAEVGAAPERALFVGDTLARDVAGAACLGMTTLQALWFRADHDVAAAEPDFQAFTVRDVLTVVRHLNGEP